MAAQLSQRQMEHLLDEAISHGGDFAEIFWEDSTFTNIQAYDEQPETSVIGREHGVGVRIFRGLSSVYTYTNDSSYDSLMALTRQAAAALNGEAQARAELEQLQRCCRHQIRQLPSGVDFAKKMELIRRASQAGHGYDPEISRMMTRYTDMEQRVTIANTQGCYAQDTRVKTRLFISAYAQNADGLQSGYIGPGAMQGFEFYDTLDVEGCAREAARTAKTMLHAQHCPAGRMSVVIDNGFGGLVFHEACGHSLEASSVAKGTSEFSGRLGQQIASPLVTLVDDGSLPNQWGSLGLDDEGTPTQRNVLIENGVLKGYLVDKLNARRMGMEPTGSGRRQNYRFAPTSRMTNTYIDNGASTPEEIIANTQRGLFVKYLNAGSVTPATGDFNFSTSEAYLIENGKITVPVKGATLIGNGGRVLQQVDMVGNNLKIGQGFCYAASGALFICAGQPTLRIADMTVGGVEK